MTFPKIPRLWTNTVLTLLTPGDQGFVFGSWPKHPFLGFKNQKTKNQNYHDDSLDLDLAFWIDQPFWKKKRGYLPHLVAPKKCVGNQRLSQVFYGEIFETHPNLIHFWAPRNEESLVFLGPLWRSVKKFHRPFVWPIQLVPHVPRWFPPANEWNQGIFFEKGWNWTPNWISKGFCWAKMAERILKPLVSRLVCLVSSLNIRGVEPADQLVKRRCITSIPIHM